MGLLKYKGIYFDEWTKDEYGVWGEICADCQKKHKDTLDSELNSNGGFGACSVHGCENGGADDDIEMNYIDFDEKLIEYIEDTE